MNLLRANFRRANSTLGDKTRPLGLADSGIGRKNCPSRLSFKEASSSNPLSSDPHILQSRTPENCRSAANSHRDPRIQAHLQTALAGCERPDGSKRL